MSLAAVSGGLGFGYFKNGQQAAAICNVELRENIGDVKSDRSFRDSECLADLLVAEPANHELQHLVFSGCKWKPGIRLLIEQQVGLADKLRQHFPRCPRAIR